MFPEPAPIYRHLNPGGCTAEPQRIHPSSRNLKRVYR